MLHHTARPDGFTCCWEVGYAHVQSIHHHGAGFFIDCPKPVPDRPGEHCQPGFAAQTSAILTAKNLPLPTSNLSPSTPASLLYDISISDDGLSPKTLTLAVGDRVRWTNHTASAIRLVEGAPVYGQVIFIPLVAKSAQPGQISSKPDAQAAPPTTGNPVCSCKPPMSAAASMPSGWMARRSPRPFPSPARRIRSVGSPSATPTAA